VKITKYIHSCLLIKEANKAILIDPGNYTAEANVLDISNIESLDYLLVTHEHQDHMYIPLIKKIIAKFPNLNILSNQSVKTLLGKEGVNVSTDSDDFIQMESIPHEKVFGSEPPINTLFNINNIFSHPGDSFSFNSTNKVLALPVQAPWGSLTQAVDLAVSLGPEIIIPIHDWHWNESAKESFYKRLEKYFTNEEIKFISLQTGIEVEI